MAQPNIYVLVSSSKATSQKSCRTITVLNAFSGIKDTQALIWSRLNKQLNPTLFKNIALPPPLQHTGLEKLPHLPSSFDWFLLEKIVKSGRKFHAKTGRPTPLLSPQDLESFSKMHNASTTIPHSKTTRCLIRIAFICLLSGKQSNIRPFLKKNVLEMWCNQR